MRVSGAAPFGLGVVAASFAAADFSAGPFDVLVDIAPGQLVLTANFGFDATGDFYAQLDLAQPALAGVSLYVQFLATGPAPLASNALEFHFTD